MREHQEVLWKPIIVPKKILRSKLYKGKFRIENDREIEIYFKIMD
jgi:hypothetical protein